MTVPCNAAAIAARARPVRRVRRPARALRRATALLLLLGGCGERSEPRDVNLVLITFDTTRADRLGAYGNDEWGESPSPHVDGLAAGGVLFETTYAPRGQTHPSLATLLTGKYPITHGLRENGFPLGQAQTTLFQHLQRAGWQTGTFTANLDVASEEWAHRGADASADGYGGRFTLEAGPREGDFQRVWDDRVERAATEWLQGIDTARPFAVWIHFYDVHRPFNPPAGLEERFGVAAGLPPALAANGQGAGAAVDQHLAEITLGDRPVPEDELRRIRGLYDGGVLATDERLGRLLDLLGGMGELDSSLVVFTSDHGDELFDHNRYFYHGSSIYDGVVRVPLVLRGPGLPAGVRVPTLVELLDVAPTVLDLLGIFVPHEMEGSSLQPLLHGQPSPERGPYAVVEWQDLVYAVSDGRHKLIWNPRHAWTRKPPWQGARVPADAGFRIDCLEGYVLQDDPREQVNVLAEVPPASVRTGADLPPAFGPLYEHLRAWRAAPEHRIPMTDHEYTPEQAQRLQGLGYIGDNVSEGRQDHILRERCQ